MSIEKYLQEAQAKLKEMQEDEISKTLDLNIDLKKYASEIRNRMANQTLFHRCRQIAMDGSQKIPQRIIGSLNDLTKLNIPAPKLAIAYATWINYLANSNAINDPLASELIGFAKTKNLRGISALLAEPVVEKYDAEIRKHLT